MATVLQLFPARVALGYATVGGQRVPIYASPEFIRALDAVFERVGGATGPSTTDLSTSDDEDSGLEEMRAETAKFLDALASNPPTPEAQVIEQLTTEVRELHALVSVLMQQVQDLSRGTDL